MAPRKNSKRSDSTSDSGPDDTEPKPAPKKAKTSSAKSSSSKDDDEPSWALDSRKFVKVREFRGKVMVDIREFYDADGELKPTKKGICLSAQQWRKLVDVIDEVDKVLSEK